MKRIILFAVASVCLLGGVTGCSDDYDDSALWNKVNGIDDDIENIKTDIEALKAKVDGLNSAYRALTSLLNGGLITDVQAVTDAAGRTGYKFTVKTVTDPDATPVQTVTNEYTIWNGTDGVAGETGETPVLSAEYDETTGRYYWAVTVGGETEPLLDSEGYYVYTDGLTPQLKVEEAEEGKLMWYVGYDYNANGTIDDDEWVDSFGPFSGDVIGNSSIDASVEDGIMTITIGDDAYSFPIAAVLGIEFEADVAAGLHMAEESVLVVSYTLTGATENAVVKAEFQNEGNFKIRTDSEAGTITITSAGYGEKAVVIVSVYDGASCYHTSFTVTADLVPLTKVALTAESYDSPYTITLAADGSGLAALCDGDGETYWHSEYYSSTLTTDDYGIYIDIDLGADYSEFACKYQTRSTPYVPIAGAPRSLRFGVSTDLESWTEVGTVTSGLPTSSNAWWDGLGTRFSNDGATFRYVRFGITSVGAGDVTNKTLELYSDCANLAELEVYVQ